MYGLIVLIDKVQLFLLQLPIPNLYAPAVSSRTVLTHTVQQDASLAEHSRAKTFIRAIDSVATAEYPEAKRTQNLSTVFPRYQTALQVVSNLEAELTLRPALDEAKERKATLVDMKVGVKPKNEGASLVATKDRKEYVEGDGLWCFISLSIIQTLKLDHGWYIHEVLE